MKDVYVFYVSLVLTEKSRALSVFHKMNDPLDIMIASTQYDRSDECITDCIKFINDQSAQMENHETVIETNPFLAGTLLDADLIELEKSKWLDNELFKVYSQGKDVSSEIIPIVCSIFKKVTYSGFYIDSSTACN